MKFQKQIVLMALICVLSACQQIAVLEELDQKNANDVLVVLSKNGIKAEKKSITKQQVTSWQILVSSADQALARELLAENNLPRQRELGLSGVCKDAGLIPTPKTEKCREMLALKGEIINSLQFIPGVVSADVVINMPDKQDFPDENVAPQRPAASVVLQVSALADAEMFTEAKIQQFVANAVTGMDMRDVVVIISRAVATAPSEITPSAGATLEPVVDEETQNLEVVPENMESASVLGLKMDQQSVGQFKFLVVLVLVIFVILSAVMVYAFLKNARFRQQRGGLAVIPQALGSKASVSREVDVEQDRVGIE